MSYNQEKIKPYSQEGEKVQQVEAMFDGIAPTYDFLNHLLSMGIDKGWRRKAIASLGRFAPKRILDIATGTGDFALLSAQIIQPREIIGADISEGMMDVARKKVQTLKDKGEIVSVNVSFQKQDCLNLSYTDSTFDAVTVAYGVRNFQDLDAGLREMHRVLTPGGHLLIVELATPPRFPMRQLFWFYAHVIMPVVGWLVSRDSRAYSYLPATMEAFPQGEVMEGILRKAGFRSVEWRRFTFGICTMYLAEK
ncbi:MAG: bifunctional demethylmenaquinone methyltransferase/2-methoxy-6-polyprenyl-1,4-benzoquinol methylase UbiE [Bacteroidaceae bacterium]|jgi:demethylmenaquinone methyltransferase/2-methoxy-6-polyprenyl-1,4-benzoquinol methylase|nr:bifunctional demethylmenaquinone methyltransferase/2-methoxy-6-polyprenyl-1,4-benzoquinol methylase UbiE [Bacteroidaceae bacterium]